MKAKEKKELVYNVVNCAIAGGLVFLGGISNGQITSETMTIAVIAAAITAVTQFKSYWAGEVSEVSKKAKVKEPKLLTFF